MARPFLPSSTWSFTFRAEVIGLLGPLLADHMLQFVELSDRERETAKPLGKLAKGDQVEVRVRRKSGEIRS